MTLFEKLSALHPDIVHNILVNRSSSAVEKDVVDFLLQLQAATEIYNYERNISRAAEKLRIRIIAETGKSIPLRTCKRRIYEALDYFSVDNNVSEKVWYSDYADKYEDLAKLALAEGNTMTAFRCMENAKDCRIKASEAADKDASWAPVFILSPDISLTQLGFEKVNLKTIAKKDNDGFYLQLINDLPIDKSEKDRLIIDANIQDAEFQEIESE